MAVAGASRYLNAATLANKQGVAPSTPNVLGSAGVGATSLLDAGRVSTGVGLSGTARSLNSQLISISSSGFNKLFSLAGVEFGTIEATQQKIKAIRASLPESRIDEALRGSEVDEEI